jgi:DNA-binding protein WhiA
LSFSSTVKNELCRMETNEKCCLLSELAAVIRVASLVRVVNESEINIRLVTENAAFARRVFSLIKRLFDVQPEIIIRKSKKFKKHVSYILVITSSMRAKEILKTLGLVYLEQDGMKLEDSLNREKGILRKNCCRRSFLRGAFLAGGSVSDPEKTYHLEITNHNKRSAKQICELGGRFGLNTKVIERKGNYVVYIKEGENIVDFLNIIGAHSALLELENVRILKGMRNDVNRIVNCETANLEKTVNASIRQIENIKYIMDNMGFDNLPQNLRDMAELRLKYSDANLKELGEMLSPPVGKSGVNHRLRKLDAIAESLKASKGEL